MIREKIVKCYIYWSEGIPSVEFWCKTALDVANCAAYAAGQFQKLEIVNFLWSDRHRCIEFGKYHQDKFAFEAIKHENPDAGRG